MENFVNNTDVSFSQLLKKDGWFSRLIFSQLIVFPIYISIFRISRPLTKMSGFSFYFLLTIGFIWIAAHLTIGFLLWKKRTRLTITVSIILPLDHHSVNHFAMDSVYMELRASFVVIYDDVICNHTLSRIQSITN